MNKELIIMQQLEYKPKTNCLSLTLKRDSKITIKNIAKTSSRIIIKTFLYALVLTFANVIV